MGNLGMPELILILVLALILFGPKKLPEIGKQVGKALGQFKRTSNDLKRTIEDEMERATKESPPAEPPPASTSPSGTAPAVEKSPSAGGSGPTQPS
jgi:TatA/E family protein of Tat protein translocase